MNAIDVHGVSVSYGPVAALRDVDLHARAGQVTGLIGPNGAGKSTLLRTILGLIEPDRGTVTIDGQAPASMRRGVAYLPQRAAIDPDYPIQVRELVALGRLPHTGLLRRRSGADRAAVDAAIARVGLQGLERRRLGRLSGGQQQRAHVARSLAQQAAIHVLDEPFAGLDAPTVALLIALFRELAAEGAAVVVVVHDLTLLAGLCDEVFLLDRTVLDHGSVAHVLDGPALAGSWLHTERHAS